MTDIQEPSFTDERVRNHFVDLLAKGQYTQEAERLTMRAFKISQEQLTQIINRVYYV